MADFKRGVGHLASRHPDIPVIPVYLDGLYRTSPKGRTLIVPFGGTLVMGDPCHFLLKPASMPSLKGPVGHRIHGTRFA